MKTFSDDCDPFIVNPNSYFDRIYVINLDRRPDREIMIRQKLRDQGIDSFERIAGVDGADLNIPDYCTSDQMSPGAWGYLLSWERILNKARREGHSRILCLDDDVIFHRDFAYQFRNIIKWIPSNWKILNLGASQHTTIELPKGDPWYHPILTDGSFATGISSEIYLELLTEIRVIKSFLNNDNQEMCLESLKSKKILPLDSGPLREIYTRYPEDCYVVYPNIIISDVRNSSIRGPRDQQRIAKKFGWCLENYLWPPRQDLVSIIIPCYNAQRSIGKSVLAARLQDYPNCEVIVVDDASTDGSSEILREAMWSQDCIIAGQTHRLHPLKVLRNTENIGCYATRNRGIQASRGKWVTFQDADDISIQERITVQLSALLRHDVLFTTCLILRSHLQDFSTINKFDRKSVMKTLETTRIHRKKGFSNDSTSTSTSTSTRGRIKTLTGLNNRTKGTRAGHSEYKYCCRGILGMVTTLFPRDLFYEIGLYWELPCTADAEFCERILFHRANKLLMGDESIVTFLSQNTHIPGLYYRIPKILYISEEMDEENITSKIKGDRELKTRFVREWRAKLLGNHEYIYPQMQ